MTDCRNVEALLEALLADSLDRDEQRRLDLHLESCENCSQLASLHSMLWRADVDLETPDRGEMAASRWAVLTRLQRLPDHDSKRFRRRAFWMAVAAAVFVLGFGLGRSLPKEEAGFSVEALDPKTLAAGETWALSSVHLMPQADGSVDLSFDLSHPVETTRAAGDPLIALAVEESLLGAPDLGAQIQAVNAAGLLVEDPAVRQTLLGVAERDSNLAVRLLSLNHLAAFAEDPDVQRALIRMAEEEEVVPVRFLAAELLKAVASETPEQKTSV